MLAIQCKQKTEILSRDKSNTAIQIADENGRFVMTAHSVFPGIQLIYNDVHIQSVHLEKQIPTSEYIFEISHCREGRLEYHANQEFCYLSPGDLSIARTNHISSSSYFPLGHYHGLTIRIDLEHTPQCLSCFLDDVTVQPRRIVEKFCGDRAGFVVRSNRSLEHIFSELYSVPAEIQKGYFKIKILELLLFLSVLNIDQDVYKKRICSKTQVTLAKEIGRYLTEHMDDRITLDQLSERFHASGTQIKTSFKGVYGVSVYSYIRTQKMQAAAWMLRRTDHTILEVAGRFGYDNASKFARAFKEVIGRSPNEYRNTAEELLL